MPSVVVTKSASCYSPAARRDEEPRGPEQRRRRRIAGTRQTGSARENASGYAAGFTIVIPILLGAALGYVVGLLVGSELLLLPLGALAGLVLGFYAVYVRFIR